MELKYVGARPIVSQYGVLDMNQSKPLGTQENFNRKE